MLLVPSATRVERTDTGADDVLRRLAALLPATWIVVGGIASKPVSDTCRRGHTRPFDAIIIGDRIIVVLDISSHAGLIANRQESAFFTRIHDKAHIEASWQRFRRETEKLKALLHDRFAVEPGRVVPDRISSRAHRSDSAEAAAAADTADLQSFARAATRRDKASDFPPLLGRTVDRIASFLIEEPRTAPEPAGSPPELYFTDERPTVTVVRRTTAPDATPEPIAAPSPTPVAAPPVVTQAAKAAAAAPAHPSHATQAQPSLPPRSPAPVLSQEPIAAPETASRTARPTSDTAPPVASQTAETAPARPSRSTQAQPSLRHPAPNSLPATPAPTAALEQAAPSMASAPAQRRPTAQWKWLAGLLLLLLVLQAGTIGWLALFDRASPHLEPARQAAPIPEPFVVRSLGTSEPMLVGRKTVTLRSGPSPNFPAVGALDAGTEVVARARASGPGGSTWIEIMAANGTIGFVPDGMVQPEPAPALAIARVEAPKQTPPPKIRRAPALTQTPAPKVQRAVAPKQKPTPKIKHAVKPAQPSRSKAVPPPPGVTCILPGGEEIQATRSDCRAQSGIIYQ